MTADLPKRGPCAAIFTLATLLAAGCGETTQTVGQIKAAAQVPAPASSVTGPESRASSTARSDASVATGFAGHPLVDTQSNPNSPDASSTNTPAPPPVPAPGCTGAAAATRRPFDMYLLVDTNISLPLTGGWTNVRNGLSRYVDDRCAAGVGVGARYFGVDCNAITYATPTTPIGLLPENAAAIKKQMPITAFNLSPTLPAIQGGLMYSRARAAKAPDSKQVIVLLSDGFFEFACLGPEAIQNLFSPGSGTISSPDLPIYVLALDLPSLAGVPSLSTLLNPMTRFAPLDAIAQGAGTGKARHIDLQAAPTVFAKALVDIQHDAQPCDYVVPDSVRLDPSSMALAGPDSSGAQAPMQLFASVSECGTGYYFDDPTSPAWATLCPSTCTSLKTRCAEPAWVSGCAPR